MPRGGYYFFERLAKINRRLRDQVSKCRLLETNLQELNVGLESQVAERTGELHASNKRLEEEVRERIQAEKNLQSVNRDMADMLHRNQTLLKTSKDGIHILDVRGNIVESNDAFCEMLGYTHEEMVGMNVADWEAQWSADELRLRLGDIIGKSAIFETLHRRKDGSTFSVEISASGVEIGGAGYIFAASRDITEHKAVESALKQHKQVVETTTDGFWMIDAQGFLLEVNQAYSRISGYSVDELKGMHISQLEAKEKSAGEVKAHIAKIMEQGGDLFETKHRRKDGQVIDIEVSATFEPESQRFYVFCRDIGERKQAFRELRLRESYLNAIIENQDGLVWLKDKDGRYLAANHYYVEMCGKSIQEIIGKTDADLWPEEIAVKYRQDDMLVIATGKAALIEEQGLGKKGELRWYETYKAPVFNETGELIATTGSSHDITERKHAENDLRISAITFESHEAILITDTNANIVRVNHAFCDVTGYSADEVLGKNPRMMSSGRHDKQFYIEMWQQLRHIGWWAGEIWDKRKNGQIYPKWVNITVVKNAKSEITGYVGIFSDITARKKTEEEIRNLAFYDPLTRLPNRRLFMERVCAALPISARNKSYGSVMFIDLDRFKVLNDTLGHEYGDLMLIEVAQRIKSCVREMDTVARLGGDEFVVLIEGISSDEQEASRKAGQVAEKIREVLASIYELKEHEHYSSPSIGITLFLGNRMGVEELLKQADMAMYKAKQSGRNRVHFFDSVMQDSVTEHVDMLSDLRHAIARQELHLHYQMRVNDQHHPVGAEALLRWIHPGRGLVMPEQFLPIAKESSLITEIDRWVLEMACRQLVQWGEVRKTRDLILSVNISAKKFASPDFVMRVTDILSIHQADPAKLKLEFTEDIMLDDIAAAISKLWALKEIGVRLAIDDFGNGYSTLSCLKKLPMGKLKIGGDFVRRVTSDVHDALLVEAIIHMANSFEMGVIAEGIETEGQLAFLKHLCCDSYQGYYFGRPVPLMEFERQIEAVSVYADQ